MSTWLLTLALLTPPQAPGTAPNVEWQRTLADALAVQKATGRPLLVCVNTDGEVFCDRFASETYVDPGFVATTRGWVCVAASPDRHTAADYDGQGRRIECPRFPGCTCSEHINIEPELFRRWFKDQRYAPRHVGVAANGTVLFDHFLDRSMQDAITDIEKHKGDAGGADAALPSAVTALLLRRDAASRRAVEALYLPEGRTGRIALLTAAQRAGNEPFDLLRMGLRDDDAAVFAAAIAALCAQATPATGIDLQDALARCEPAQEKALLTACAKLAAADQPDQPTAQFLAHRRAALAGIAKAKGAFHAIADVATTPTADRTAIEAALDHAEQAARTEPNNAAVLVALAQANLELAWFLLPSSDSTVPFWFEDARRAAERAAGTAGPAERPAAEAIQAIARRQQGKNDEARAHAEAAFAAIQKAGKDFDAAPRWVADLLRTAASSAAATAYATVQAEPLAVATAAVTDAAFAFAALQTHPWADAADAQQGAALLAWAGARKAAQDLLVASLRRWPAARELHAEFRGRILADGGAEALRRDYATVVAASPDPATAEWFAGYAAIVAAEQHVTDQRPLLATRAYTDCIERMQKSAAGNQDFADSANHFAVLALAGRALQHHLAGDGGGAVDDLLAAIALRPASMSERDGLGRTPDAMLRRIARELREQGKADLATRLPQG